MNEPVDIGRSLHELGLLLNIDRAVNA